MISRLHNSLLLALILLVTSNTVHAAEGAPKVGRAAAAKYFQTNPDAQKASRYVASESGGGSSSGDRYLTFGVSTFTKSESFSWGTTNKEEDVGKWGVDLNYKISDYNSLLDYALRVNYNEYEPNGQRVNKMAFLLAASFPDAASRFPLYFGAAAGPGVFFKQINDESRVTLDYQLFMGLRLFEIFDKTGFYIEGGLRNHIQLTSDGQLNGTYISAGAVFTF